MISAVNFPIGAGLQERDLEGDLHPVLHRLRATEPVSWLPSLQTWLVTRYDLAVQVMRDARRFTVNHPGFSTARVVGPSMLSLDHAEHQRHRRPFESPFRRREVLLRFREAITAQAGLLAEALAGRGQAELRRDYAGPIAVNTMITALGLQAVSVPAILGWYDSIVEAVTRITAGEAAGPAGRSAFAALRAALLPALEQQPEASLLAAARSRAGALSEAEIISNAAVLLFGGIETTEGMIANALYYLLTDADLLARARADNSLLPAVIAESLRLEPAAAVVDRYAVEDIRLEAAPIRAGDLVRVSLSGANRDPAVFPNPDRFDPLRPNLRSQVAFAQGPHVCLGIHLARLEAHLALETLLNALPGLQLEDPRVARPRGLVFRKPPALRVRWQVQQALA